LPWLEPDPATGYEQTTAYADPNAIAGTPAAVDGTTTETP
jgi:hypothetical protein